MMAATFQIILLLLAVLVVVAIAARRLNIAPSILLVIAGVGLALIPGLPALELAPELVLLIILPPLIYSAGVSMSWREFRFNLRPIALLAFGCVVFTTVAVAAAVHWIFGLPWAVGFLLGAIVSPPDVVAPLAVARRLRLPRRLLLVLEGEGLANDATALILYRFAVVAISTGSFSLGEAAGTFAAIVVGEIAYGIGIGWLSLRIRRWAGDPRVEITLSLMTPYLAYWVPEHLGGSGVLATIAAGLYVSWRGPLLISSTTRLQGIFFWDLIIYLIEGFVFLLTGLQARTLFEHVDRFALHDLAVSTVVVTAVVIIARFIWVYPAVYLPRWLSPALARRDPLPPWQQTFVLAFIGVRGVVSLAAALALPLTLASGANFPHRDRILFITFGVIIITLVGLGLMLPAVIRWLGLARHGELERKREHESELVARREAIEAALRRLEELEAGKKIPKEITELLRTRHDHRRRQLLSEESRTLGADLKLELIQIEREYIYQLLRDGRITDEARRKLERELDLEEAGILSRRGEEIIPLITPP
jgi:CPA1 family monovalent cation:H+ antiporter